jgi:hypothetical protein
MNCQTEIKLCGTCWPGVLEHETFQRDSSKSKFVECKVKNNALALWSLFTSKGKKNDIASVMYQKHQ